VSFVPGIGHVNISVSQQSAMSDVTRETERVSTMAEFHDFTTPLIHFVTNPVYL
jgi:hypothetical protein